MGGGLARLESDLVEVGADGIPTIGVAVGRLARADRLWLVNAIVDADEGVAAGVEAIDGTGAGE